MMSTEKKFERFHERIDKMSEPKLRDTLHEIIDWIADHDYHGIPESFIQHFGKA